ncbi:hypothetical protein D3C84_1062010 [compost metagenome]
MIHIEFNSNSVGLKNHKVEGIYELVKELTELHESKQEQIKFLTGLYKGRTQNRF